MPPAPITHGAGSGPAVALLRHPGSNVGAVAFEVGYHSANFYRALGGLTGLTPSEIRQLPESEAATMPGTLDLPAPALVRPRAWISA